MKRICAILAGAILLLSACGENEEGTTNESVPAQETNIITVGWNTRDGRTYLVERKTGWHELSGDWYYLDPDNDGRMVCGRKEIEGSIYYFDTDGHMQTGWVETSDRSDNTVSWYYYDANGLLCTGWREIDGTWYYFTEGEGRMCTGFQLIDGQTYWFDENGHMATGTVRIDGVERTFDENGHLIFMREEAN